MAYKLLIELPSLISLTHLFFSLSFCYSHIGLLAIPQARHSYCCLKAGAPAVSSVCEPPHPDSHMVNTCHFLPGCSNASVSMRPWQPYWKSQALHLQSKSPLPHFIIFFLRTFPFLTFYIIDLFIMAIIYCLPRISVLCADGILNI